MIFNKNKAKTKPEPNPDSVEAQPSGVIPNSEVVTLSELSEKELKLFYKRRYWQILRSTVSVLIVAAAVAVLIATLIMPVMQIYGSSMSPTLEDEQIVVSVKTRELKRGDLVAFYYGNKLLIKRVIACPGDWIEITQDGDVYINSKPIDEPYLKDKALGECDQNFPLQIPDEKWFLMGDNRSVSLDSRSTAMGLISLEQIVGKVKFRVWPFDRMGKIS